MAAAIAPAQFAALAVVVGGLLGWLFAFLLRRQDLRTFLFARAPALPVRALSAHDDAWLRGSVRSDEPLRCPWFDQPCVAYDYKIEDKKTETYKDSDGNTRTRTSWTTVHTQSDEQPFQLDDGERVTVALPEGKLEAQRHTGSDYEWGSRRHSASLLPVDEIVSAFGVLRDDGTFGPFRNVPLVVTFKTRAERVARADSHEGVLFCFALLFPYVGAVVAAGILLHAEDWQRWSAAGACGLILLLPQWALLTFNRLVRLRQQVRAAEKQITIELGQRFDLVPNLVAVVRAASSHESELLADLGAIRAGKPLDQQVRDEEQVRGAAHAVLVLHERYPDLKVDVLYRDLHERLWAIEEKIAHARGFYNDTVTEWNDRVEKFPSTLVAKLAGHRALTLFAAGAEVELPPRLDLD